jgi:proteasome lid subunit RPN8/RPN11
MTTAVPPRIRISHRRLDELVHQLALRGEGRRESGAFLLGRSGGGKTANEVVDVAFYDDLDPDSLTGGITFNGVGYSALGAICRQRQLRVIADIHTHPGRSVQQSDTDAQHPMTALPGHIAFIAPNFAQGPIRPEHLGAHRFDGTTWTSYFGDNVTDVIGVFTASPFHRLISAVTDLLRIRKARNPERSRS